MPPLTVKLVPGEIILRLEDDLANAEGIVCCEDDFTFYLSREEVLDGLVLNLESEPKLIPEGVFDEQTIKKLAESEIAWEDIKRKYAEHLKSSIDANIVIKCWSSKNNFAFNLEGRANLASYHNNQGFSVTMRRKDPKKLESRAKELLKEMRPDTVIVKGVTGGNKECELAVINPPKVPSGTKDFLFDIDITCRVLSRRLFADDIKTGLIVIAGGTGSGKSQVAFGLIWQYIRTISKWKRRPHLITLEDPIENKGYFHSIDEKNKGDRGADHGLNRRRGFDYTPRNLRVDAVSLKQALLDAKRMTPAVVFIGETRDAEDWRQVVDFAGSGHLVITTTHAGSLVESIQRIFKAIDAKTPAERGNAAQSLLAVVHLQPLVLERPGTPPNKPEKINACVPALWMNAGGGAANLVADGLASIVPNNPASAYNPAEAKGSLGRHWFVHAFQKEAKQRLEKIGDGKAEHEKKYAEFEDYWPALQIKTLTTDLTAL
ncbi:MAG TPA: ATPase, T2SS/T4P/T4SS family [Verrucomicrobiae bacterium]|nr:ATPase, T2SS/T4P/T4SS family [Verrucomicrobiae bacterium]